MEPARQRQIAIGLAGAATALAVIATVVVIARSGGEAAKTPAAPAVVVEDRDLPFEVLERIGREYDPFVDAGNGAKGVRLRDGELAAKLGLQPDDTIVAWEGRTCDKATTARSAAMRTGYRSDRVERLYLEVVRAGKPMLVRFNVSEPAQSAGGPKLPWNDPAVPWNRPPTTPATPSDPDTVADSIKTIDDTHAEVPRAARDQVLADPTKLTYSARVVPSTKDGHSYGMKLYAIRPSGVFGKLNFHNGDTVLAINGFRLDTPDSVLDAYVKLRAATEFDIDIERRGQRALLHVAIK
jgi:hypothetical protein